MCALSVVVPRLLVHAVPPPDEWHLGELVVLGGILSPPRSVVSGSYSLSRIEDSTTTHRFHAAGFCCLLRGHGFVGAKF